MTTSAGMRALAMTFASTFITAEMKGMAHVFSYTARRRRCPTPWPPRLGDVVVADQTRSGPGEHREPAELVLAEVELISRPRKVPSSSLRITTRSSGCEPPRSTRSSRAAAAEPSIFSAGNSEAEVDRSEHVSAVSHQGSFGKLKRADRVHGRSRGRGAPPVEVRT